MDDRNREDNRSMIDRDELIDEIKSLKGEIAELKRLLMEHRHQDDGKVSLPVLTPPVPEGPNLSLEATCSVCKWSLTFEQGPKDPSNMICHKSGFEGFTSDDAPSCEGDFFEPELR